MTVKTYVNGNLVSEKNATLGRKGDSTYVLDLIRQNSMFRVQ